MRCHRLVKFNLLWISLVLLLSLGSTSSAASANISHSYQATTVIDEGSLVSLDPERVGYVVPANSTNGAQLIGVAVTSNDSLLAIDERAGATQVATSGVANALVSTLNGSIEVGDGITVSPLNGIGMKASPGDRILGLAQAAFNQTTKGANSRSVSAKNGHKTEVSLGYLAISIAIGTQSSSGNGPLSGLQRVAQGVTGHQVSVVRVVLSLIVTLIALIVLITLIYTSIFSSIISIGRNPLAKRAIMRDLTGVLAMAVTTAGVAGATIWLLLR